jgi:PREDICTED: similar to pol
MKKQTIIAGAILASTTTGTAFAEEVKPTTPPTEIVATTTTDTVTTTTNKVEQPAETTEATTTTENLTPIEKAEKTVDETAKAVTNAETSTKDTFEKETQAKSDYDNATKEAHEAQVAVNKTKQDKTNAETKLAEDKTKAPELDKKLEAAKKDVTDTEKQISDTGKDLASAKKHQTDEEAKIQPQVDALNDATSAKKNAQDKVDSIKGDLKTNQETEATLTNEINELTSAKEAANKEVTSTGNALENAKKADQTRANNIASQKTIVAQDTTDKNNAIATEKEKTAEKEKLATDLDSAKKALADNLEIPLTDAYISALKTYKENKTTANSEAVNKIAQEILKSKAIQEAMKLLKESDTRTVDPSNLTTEQLKELNVRMAQFIEDVRTKFGTFSPTMVRVSEESVNLSKLIGETYKNAIRKAAGNTNPTVWNAAEMGHLKSNETVAPNLSKAGYNTTALPARMETLAYSVETNKTTMGELKAEIYNSMIRWLYDDDLSDWGHALIQSGLVWNYKKTELQTFLVQDGSYLMVGAVETSLKEQDSKLQTKEYDIPTTDFNAANARVTTLEKQIETNKAELAQASKNVKSTTQKLEDSTNELKRLEAVEILTPKAQEAYDNAVAKHTDLSNQLTNKKNALDAVQSKIKELKIALPQAETNLENATKVYNNAKSEYDKVSADVEKVKEEVKRIENKLETLNTKLNGAKTNVTSTQKEIADNNKEIEDLTNSIKELEKQLKEQETTLKEKVKVQKEKEAIYLKAKKAADVERAKIAELKAKHEEAVTQLEALKEEQVRKEQRQKEEQAREEQRQREFEDYNRAIDEVLYGTNATANTTTPNKSKNTLPVTNTSNESIYIVIVAAILAVLAGLGLYFKKNNKKD